jgi:hypothetical protein
MILYEYQFGMAKSLNETTEKNYFVYKMKWAEKRRERFQISEIWNEKNENGSMLFIEQVRNRNGWFHGSWNRSVIRVWDRIF